MRKTLKEMRDFCLRFVEREGDVQLGDIADQYINRHYDEIAKAEDWDELNGLITNGFSFTADAAYVALPEDCATLKFLQDTRNDFRLVKTSLERLLQDHASEIDNAAQGVWRYATLGRMATKRPLSANDTLEIVAESSSDTSVPVRVTGLRETPELQDTEEITTNASDGTTVVSGTTSWRLGWSIGSISVDGPLNGYIEVREDSTPANVLAHLTEHRRESSYEVAQLAHAFSSATDARIVYKKKVHPLRSDNDTIVIDASDAIEERTIASLKRYRQEYRQADEHDKLANRSIGATVTERDGQTDQYRQARPDFRGHFRGTRWRRGFY